MAVSVTFLWQLPNMSSLRFQSVYSLIATLTTPQQSLVYSAQKLHTLEFSKSGDIHFRAIFAIYNLLELRSTVGRYPQRRWLALYDCILASNDIGADAGSLSNMKIYVDA